MTAKSRKWFMLYLANNSSLRELILTDVWFGPNTVFHDYLSLVKALELSPVEYIETTLDNFFCLSIDFASWSTFVLPDFFTAEPPIYIGGRNVNVSVLLLVTDQYLRRKTRLWKSIVPRGLLCNPHELLVDHLPDNFQLIRDLLESFISEEFDTKLQLYLQSILHELRQEPVTIYVPAAAPTHRRKKSIREIYDERNHRRNQFLPEDRICKGCDTVWPAGSIKIQKFEGLQSKCARDVSKCCSSRDFHLAFPRED